MKMTKSSIGKFFIIFSVVPVLLIGTIITMISTSIIYKVKVDDTKNQLRGTAMELIYSYELITSDNDFKKVNGEVYAGDCKISGDFTIVDRLKEYTGVDVTLFYQNTRVVTTIEKENGDRLVGVDVDEQIWSDNIQLGEEYFDEKVLIDGKEYFGYYIPIVDSKSAVVGISFAGTPTDDLVGAIKRLNHLSVSVCVVLVILSLICSVLAARSMLGQQVRIMEYLKEMNEGEFDHSIDSHILRHHDEYRIMGNYAVKLNSTIKNLVQRDSLTGLYNRRAAMQQLHKYIQEANQVKSKPFCLAIGDIDWFKRVNDTYGHSCGDDVLKNVSNIFLSLPPDKGVVARWGGEEFLVIINGDMYDALPVLRELVKKVCQSKVDCEGQEVRITMTFGICRYTAPGKLDTLISNADRLLYKGKENGRNQIVT